MHLPTFDLSCDKPPPPDTMHSVEWNQLINNALHNIA